MSRCFPYPPPGYEKKAQQPDLSLASVKVAQKEKHKGKEKEKEKKVKDGEKDKKDKEKKDREKKDKDKDKEKKDKEKNKDKDKDKERRDKDRRDKDKDKDKREKRKKDGETNGTSHDKDPRSSKLQRTDVLHSTEENGRVRDIKTTAAVVARPLDRVGKDGTQPGKDAAKPPDNNKVGKEAAAKPLDNNRVGKDAAAKPLDRNGKDAAAAMPRASIGGSRSSSITREQQEPSANGKVDTTLPPLVLTKPVTAAQVPAPTSLPSNHDHCLVDGSINTSGSHRGQKSPDFSVCLTMPQHTSWSAVDDEDWLAPSSEGVRRQPKAEGEQGSTLQVWAEAIFLPSHDMYALPYVVPF